MQNEYEKIGRLYSDLVDANAQKELLVTDLRNTIALISDLKSGSKSLDDVKIEDGVWTYAPSSLPTLPLVMEEKTNDS